MKRNIKKLLLSMLAINLFASLQLNGSGKDFRSIIIAGYKKYADHAEKATAITLIIYFSYKILTDKGRKSRTKPNAKVQNVKRRTTKPTVTVIPEVHNNRETQSFLSNLGNIEYSKLKEAILKNPEFVNARSEGSKFTALQIAVRDNGDAQVVQYLLSAGADVDAQNEFGWTALHIAAAKNNLDMVQLLLDNDASASTVSNDRQTALHLAAMRDNAETVTLLAQRTDIQIVDREERKAIDRAKKDTTRAAFMTGQGQRLLARL